MRGGKWGERKAESARMEKERKKETGGIQALVTQGYWSNGNQMEEFKNI